MRSLLWIWLLIPALAHAGQDTAPRSAAPRVIALLSTAPRPVHPGSGVVQSVTLDPTEACEAAVTAAEIPARLPPRLLHAISVTESGRLDAKHGAVRAWPWTINAEGEGHFFDTKQDAIEAVKALRARGVQSIDVGCMQVNLMFHPDAFTSLEDAFDPYINAVYAARFLNVLYGEGHDWLHAIAAYHSETPALGDAYRVLVMARWQNPVLRDAGPVQSAYRDFAAPQQQYGAFRPIGSAYGAFNPASNR